MAALIHGAMMTAAAMRPVGRCAATTEAGPGTGIKQAVDEVERGYHMVSPRHLGKNIDNAQSFARHGRRAVVLGTLFYYH
ncbi:hypothetical protein ACU4GI_42955 [Cupriavidus basilensis]